MSRTPAKSIVCLAVLLVGVLVLSSLPVKVASEGTRDGPIVLIVGGQDKMKTRNPLPALANDVWTSDVLGRVYDSIGQARPDTDELVPYIIKGIDVNGNGQFDTNEYGKFAKATGPLDVTAYYDFNGIYFHDGVQANAGDLFFSYQLQALNPRSNVDLRVLMDRAGKSGSNYTVTRWLFMYPTQKTWINEPTTGDPTLRIAVKFKLQEPFANFYRSTLTGYTLYPRHVWEGTGWRADTSSSGCSPTAPCTVPNLHTDFGRAIYPENDPQGRFGQGIPTTDTTNSPYAYLNSATSQADSAEEWQPNDRDVIGTGPFYLDFFDQVKGDAVVVKNPYFYTGSDYKTKQLLDPLVAAYIHQPYIDKIWFSVYASATLGILALTKGDIDFYHWSLAPEFVPPLVNNPNIRIWNRPEPGFFYLAYNMRNLGVGAYNWNQPSQVDVGLHFRKALAHLIDKAKIVKEFLQNYGVPGVVPLNPENIRFYNSSLTRYAFSEDMARQEISLAHNDSLALVSQVPDAVNWYTYQGGKLYLPGKGTNQFDLLCPNADYDPVRANSCSMIAAELQKMGIQVRALPTAFSAITAAINAHTFDMYILGWRIGGNDPDYFYSFFHSSNAASGQNYGGFNDQKFDEILEATRSELDEVKRVELFKWAEGILWDKLPYDTLYFRTNIEAERQDHFVGWMPSSGTIWNYWSLLNIKPPSNKRLSVSVEAPSAMESGSTRSVTVRVKDQNGNPLTGANITLELTPKNAGNFSGGGKPANVTYVGQSSSGQMLVNYVAPNVTSVFNATITASVTYPEFPDAGNGAIVTVFPAGVPFLAVTLQFMDTDVASAGESLRFGLKVTNQLDIRMDNAQVSVTLRPRVDSPAGVSPSQGLASGMTQITFTAPVAGKLPYDENTYTMTVTANLTNYNSGTKSVSLIVVKPYKTCPNGDRIPEDQNCKSTGLPGIDVVTTLAVIGAIAVMYAVVRRRKQ